MEIIRDRYLNELISRKNNKMIKIITGIRRSGKSYLLFRQFYRSLLMDGIDESHIIKIALDDWGNKEFRNPDVLYNHVKKSIVDDEVYYVLLDEVQLVDQFEDVLNGLLHIDNCDVFVTGSNAKFLSKDIITEFRGRGDQVHIYPLSFKEFKSAKEGDINAIWNEYITYGGLPQLLTLDTEEKKANYLIDLFQETYILDIINRNNVKNTSELEELVNILASSIGSLTNPNKLSNTFRSVKNVEISSATIKVYIDYLLDSFILSESTRFDIKGKKYINTPYKYYFTDIGLRNARLNFRQQEETHIMENVIYNELLIRGYNVDVGVVTVSEKNDNGSWVRKQLEIDFVVNKGSKRYYIQSAYQMPVEEKRVQEERPLINVGDSFKKIIIVKDNILTQRDENGITTIGLFEFLLNDDSLDL